ncbi:type II toxin-antitoxin system VapC family toxin [Aerosakkonema sp. BLCC-F183]|uniref:type II toxin-antitoxin system VapC family toxin n=1 Tax=Aerosakkonema sp. BLCC-F183 TaxID=3342834 RepID=UPI0035B7DB11
MTRFVLDYSVAISWCMLDESNAQAEAILDLLAEDSEAVVPWIFWLEIVNCFLVSERRGRLTEANVSEGLAMLRALRIVVDANTTQESINTTWELGRQYNLAAYDAAYLELAIREGLLLATIDNKLAEAARDCDVLLTIPREDVT